MPITQDLGGKNLVVGRGRIYFDRFPLNFTLSATLRGEGERYLGSSPEISTNASAESLDHYDMEEGLKVKDDSIQLSQDRGGSFTLENIDRHTLALYYTGDAATVTQSSATGVSEVITVKKGLFYQLGMSASLPAGVRNVTVTSVTVASSSVAASGNWEVDEARGRLRILPGSSIADDAVATVLYDVAATAREQVVSKNQAIYGALRFVAGNARGANRDHYYPYVKLMPDGDYNLKSDEWQSMSFTFEILKKASSVEAAIIDGQGA